MKKLSLTIAEKETLYGVLNNCGAKDVSELRTVSKIFDCLEKGSKKTEMPKKDGEQAAGFKVEFNEGEVVLEDTEFQLAENKLGEFKEWRGVHARIIPALIDKMEKVKEEK